MATADLNQCLQVPGRLVINPSDLSAAYPYGGTDLGAVHNIVARRTSGTFDVTASEYGGAVVESIQGGENWVLGAYLRQYDNDAISTVFPNTATGTSTKRPGVKHWLDAASPVRPGALGSARSVKLLFAPYDVDRCRAVYFYRALPRVEETWEMSLSVDTRVEVPVLFVAIPDASLRCVVNDFLREITL